MGERAANFSSAVIRPAKREDCSEIMRLVNRTLQELADFEKMPDAVKTTRQILERDGFDAPHPAFLSYVAEDPNQPGKAVGYAVCYICYDGFRGKAFFIEDIMVTENFRRNGIGKRLFQYLCKEALERECQIVRFYVLDWNPASRFYAKMGAIDATESEGWHWHIMYKEEMEKVAGTQF